MPRKWPVFQRNQIFVLHPFRLAHLKLAEEWEDEVPEVVFGERPCRRLGHHQTDASRPFSLKPITGLSMPAQAVQVADLAISSFVIALYILQCSL